MLRTWFALISVAEYKSRESKESRKKIEHDILHFQELNFEGLGLEAFPGSFMPRRSGNNNPGSAVQERRSEKGTKFGKTVTVLPTCCSLASQI